MSFITGLLIIDAPASALNNKGAITGSATDNAIGVKFIPGPAGSVYPYVSAQAFRYWLREALEKSTGWQSSPIFREKKIAYTDANPIRYWDDDLLGYMRAPSKKAEAVSARNESGLIAESTPTSETVTRVSPLRVSTLVSIAPVRIVSDFGTMSRHEGDPVPHEHQFYRATLQGLFSLDLNAAGTFTYLERTGYLNLDEPRVQEAKEKALQHLPEQKAYRLPQAERITRIRALLEAFAHVNGGAKQSLHYTDTTPDVIFAAVTRGGNHLFGHIFNAQGDRAALNVPALEEALRVYADDLLSDVYIGWVRGFADAERAKLEEALAEGGALHHWHAKIHLSHPREAFAALSAALEQNPNWLA